MIQKSGGEGMQRGVSQWLRRLAGWGDIIFAAECPLCQRSTAQELCQDCWTQVERCRWTHPVRETESPSIFAWGHYRGALKQTIAALKYDQHRQLARPLGRWLAQSWLTQTQHPRNLMVVPIPLHISKQKERGFNQAELVGRPFCEFTRLPLEPQGLIRSRATEAQFHLSPEAREQNLSAAFELGTLRDRTQRAVLLLDDIYTTGATTRAAIQVLQRSNIPVYGIVAVARAGDPGKNFPPSSPFPVKPPAYK
ncbi:ComF family protein [Egbenema bharatensis]|uniref:ComF family protein n=1 Tax=Egbenema bharatensis TaxID=3463334 RepID=UPI003A8A2C93